MTVRIAACAVCHSDITYMQGGWGGALPAVYGHEAAGVVETVGPGRRRLAPGDHVVVTLIRSCGSCHYCAQGKPVLCEGSFRLDAEGPIHDARRRAAAPGDADRRLRRARDRPRLADGGDPEGRRRSTARRCSPAASSPASGAVFNTAQVPAGRQVVVIGTGGVGLNSVQGAALARCAHDHRRSISPTASSLPRAASARPMRSNPAREDLPDGASGS